MKTCARCGRTYPQDQTLCSQCGLSLPGMRGLAGAVAGPADPRVAQIDFLLAEIDQWVQAGWVAPEQARRLWDVYQDRRQRLAPPAAPLVDAAAFSAVAAPAPVIVPPPPAAPLPGRKIALAAFLEERNLSLWQLLGALLLLAGLAGLIGWTWGSVGKYLVLALMLGLTGGLAGLARSRFVRNEPLTRSGLTAIAALLVPLDIVAVNAFRLLGGALGTDEIGLAASLASLPLYAWLARREPGRWPAGLLGADLAAGLYFALRLLLPHSLPPETRGLVYGLSFASLTLGFFLAARRAGEARREVWRGAAQVSALSALALALWLGGLGTLGPAAAPLLLLGLAYAVAAMLFEDRGYVFTAQAALSVGGILALYRLDPQRGSDHWVYYAVWGQAVGLASQAASRRLGSSRAALASACADGGLALAGLALVGQGVRLVYDCVQSPSLSVSAAEIGGLLLPALLSLGYFAWTRRGTAAASVIVYLVVLVYWLGSQLGHLSPNFALPLAVSALLLWKLKRPTVSLAAAVIGLLLCAFTAFLGQSSWLSTVVALPLLLLVFALRERGGEDASVWPLTGAAVLEVLLLESRLLPWASAHAGWELNYGFGLVPLSIAALAVSERRGQVWLWAGLVAAAGNVLLQLGYAGFGPLSYSPLLLLALGAVLAVGVAFVRPGSRAADCGMGLLALFYLAFGLGGFGGYAAAGREALAAAVLCGFAPLTAWLAYWERRPALIYMAALAGALGIVHELHRLENPASTRYAAALWPYAAVLFGAAIMAQRRRSVRWTEPLLNAATAASLFALLTATLETLLRSSAGGTSALLAVVCAYGALYAAAGFALRSSPLAGLAAFALSGAFWLAIGQYSPSVSGPRQGFVFSFGGLVWLALAAGAERIKAARFAALPLNSAAVGVGLAAILVALVHLGGADGRFAVSVLLVAGSVFLGAARGLASPGWGQAGVLAYFCAYFAFLMKQLGVPGVPDSDFYLIPAGLYVLALGLMARRREGPNTAVYFLAGLLLVLTPTFAAAWAASAAPLHAVLLLTECVGAVFYGIAARIKIFAGAGAAFLLALLLRETQGVGGHIHWAVTATLLGLLILASALYFEKRGEAVRRWAKETREKLNDWD